jgi:hypothetical protein
MANRFPVGGFHDGDNVANPLKGRHAKKDPVRLTKAKQLNKS